MPNIQRSSTCRSFQSAALSRRALLRVGGMGLLGLTMPKFLRAADPETWTKETVKAIAPRAKSVIFLYQFGGPSHIDMFDMKPDAPEAFRGPHKPISSNVPGFRSPSGCRASPRSWTRSR